MLPLCYGCPFYNVIYNASCLTLQIFSSAKKNQRRSIMHVQLSEPSRCFCMDRALHNSIKLISIVFYIPKEILQSQTSKYLIPLMPTQFVTTLSILFQCHLLLPIPVIFRSNLVIFHCPTCNEIIKAPWHTQRTLFSSAHGQSGDQRVFHWSNGYSPLPLADNSSSEVNCNPAVNE